MSDDGDSDADDGDSATDTGQSGRLDQCDLSRCPRCGTPIAQKTMIGPGEAIAGPCGCRVAPTVPNSESEPGTDSDTTPNTGTDRSKPN